MKQLLVLFISLSALSLQGIQAQSVDEILENYFENTVGRDTFRGVTNFADILTRAVCWGHVTNVHSEHGRQIMRVARRGLTVQHFSNSLGENAGAGVVPNKHVKGHWKLNHRIVPAQAEGQDAVFFKRFVGLASHYNRVGRVLCLKGKRTKGQTGQGDARMLFHENEMAVSVDKERIRSWGEACSERGNLQWP